MSTEDMDINPTDVIGMRDKLTISTEVDPDFADTESEGPPTEEDDLDATTEEDLTDEDDE